MNPPSFFFFLLESELNVAIFQEHPDVFPSVYSDMAQSRPSTVAHATDGNVWVWVSVSATFGED